MRFRTPDGKEFSGRSYDEIVEGMAGEKLRTPRSLKRYRRATAHRVAEMYEAEIDMESNREFVLSLERVGLLVKV